jgi:hypothetical protein
MERNNRVEAKFTIPKAVLVSAACLAPFFAANLAFNYIRFESIFSGGYSSLIPGGKVFAFRYFPIGLIGSTISPGRSMFLFSPVLFLFPFYVLAFRRKIDRPSFILITSLIVSYFLFYCFYNSFSGDWCFGPRYYLPMVPFMIMPLIVIFEGSRKKPTIKKMIIITVIVISIVTQIVFTTSNTWLSNAVKYGIDDDSRPELSAKTKRPFGSIGTWKGSWVWLWSYFPIKYSQFYNQFKIFRWTAMISIDEANIRSVADEMLRSESPFVKVYIDLLREFDIWWLQRMCKVPSWIVIIPSALGISSFIMIFWTLRRTKSSED